MNVQEESQSLCSPSEGLSYAGIKDGIILLYWVVLETTQAAVCAQASSATPLPLQHASCVALADACWHLQAPARLQTLILCFGD